MGNSTHCKIVTPKNFNLKLCTRNYVGKATHHANFGFNRYSRDVSPYRRNITTLWLFFWLSCPVLSFFLGNAPRSNRWTDFHTLWLKRRVFASESAFSGLGLWLTSSDLRRICPQNYPKMGVNRPFQAKTENIKITITPKLWIRSRSNLRTNRRPTIALRGLSNVI